MLLSQSKTLLKTRKKMHLCNPNITIKREQFAAHIFGLCLNKQEVKQKYKYF